MLDPQKQSEKIAEKANEVNSQLIRDIQSKFSSLNYSQFSFSDVEGNVKDAIHGAVASGYLLCLQTLQQVETEMKNDVNENVRGM